VRGWPLLFAAVSLLAAERSGPYLSVGYGLGYYEDDSRLGSIESRDAGVYRVGAGAFINPYFSVALEFAQFDPFDGTDSGGKVSEHFRTFCADVITHYPIADDRLDLYAKFGAGQVFWNETGAAHRESTAATLLYGLGIGIRPKSWLTINIGYDLHRFGMESNVTTYDMQLGSAYLECQVQF